MCCFSRNNVWCYQLVLFKNNTNDDIVFSMDHQKNVLKDFRFATKPTIILSFLWITRKQLFQKPSGSMTILSFLWITKKYVSKAFRFATKPTTVLSFMWITKKIFQKPSGSQQNKRRYCLSCGSQKMFQKPSDSQQNQRRYCLSYGSQKNVSKAFRFATKPRTLLSFLWVTRKWVAVETWETHVKKVRSKWNALAFQCMHMLQTQNV
jgi:hypothetical protein